MIPKETIEKIHDEARIDEVVGDFVALKKRGANMLGNCPFHNEKTPSFTVSPAKGIFKCFGCGASGNSVNFVMQHEQMSYPEALKFLAKKYNIEVQEEEITPEEKEKSNARESLFLATQFAKDHFINNLHNTDEGKSVGLGYFKSRGVSDEMLEKFGLGYSFEENNHFAKIAQAKGYKTDNLVNAGLISNKNNRTYDRFRGRVIFPIHNISGRAVGFGARILQLDKKAAKYLNSPETDIYHKSNVLYGLHLAKRAMIQQDNCYLVEGYTDVISFHQKEIENVVASSGTSLTPGQIKLIKRFTPNITVLYDGDAAGIKASFRGIDLILKEGMNVKVITFPDGEDPDSFARKNTTTELEEFIQENAQDFINFKTSILLKDAGNDPIKKAGLIKDVMQSISLIPDMIIRSVYTKEAANLLEIGEQTLINELNKTRRDQVAKETKFKGTTPPPESDMAPPPDFLPPDLEYLSQEIQQQGAKFPPKNAAPEFPNNFEEATILRLLMQFGHIELELRTEEESEKGEVVNTHTITIAEYIISDLNEEEMSFENPKYQSIWITFQSKIQEGEIPTEKFFLQSSEAEMVKQVIEITDQPHELGNWQKHSIFVTTEEDKIRLAVNNALNSLKLTKIKYQISEITTQIESGEFPEEVDVLITQLTLLNHAKKTFSSALGRNL
mgnify:CR=1 FL=1